MEENRIAKRVLYMNLESTRPRGRPRNKWQDEVREDGRIVGGEEWQKKVYNREKWKKLLRTARNHRILHVPMERNRTEYMNEGYRWERQSGYTVVGTDILNFYISMSDVLCLYMDITLSGNCWL
jgi:hypothetical protein